MNKFIIIGAGLTGLSCAFKLIHMEILPKDIELFEARQEIGSPTRSPGISLMSKNINFLLDNIKLQKLTLLRKKENFLTFRREWLEKSLLIYLTSLGCKINLKTIVNENKLIEITTPIEKPIIINCAGKKKSSSGFPGDFTNFINTKYNIINVEYKNLIKWNGYLLIKDNINTIKNDSFISINKEEGINEVWTNNENKIIKQKEKLIEIINSSFPESIDDILANNTIDRGFLLANNAIGDRE